MSTVPNKEKSLANNHQVNKSSFRIMQSAFSEQLQEENRLNNRLNWISRNYSKISKKFQDFKNLDDKRRYEAISKAKVLRFLLEVPKVKTVSKILEVRLKEGNKYHESGRTSVNTIYMCLHGVAKEYTKHIGDGLSLSDLSEEKILTFVGSKFEKKIVPTEKTVPSAESETPVPSAESVQDVPSAESETPVPSAESVQSVENVKPKKGSNRKKAESLTEKPVSSVELVSA